MNVRKSAKIRRTRLARRFVIHRDLLQEASVQVRFLVGFAGSSCL